VSRSLKTVVTGFALGLAVVVPPASGADSLTISSHSVARGDRVTATVLTHSREVVFLLSRDRRPGRGDVLVRRVIARRHPAAHAIWLRTSLTIPRSTRPAGYFLLACASRTSGCAGTPLAVGDPVPGTSVPGSSPAPQPAAPAALVVPPLPPAPVTWTDDAPPGPCPVTITRMVATSPTTIAVTTSAPLDPATVGAFNFLPVPILGGAPDGFVTTAVSVDRDTVTLTTPAQIPGRYFHIETGFGSTPPKGIAGGELSYGPVVVIGYTPGADPEYLFTAPPPPCVPGTTYDPAPVTHAPVHLTAITAASPTTVVLRFSEALDPATVIPNGMQFPSIGQSLGSTDALQVTQATANGATVTLTTSRQAAGSLYQLIFSNGQTMLDAGPTGVSGQPFQQPPTWFAGFGSVIAP
jgi:hypothetical protein